VDALVVIGGEDTLGVATRLHAENLNVWACQDDRQ